WIRIRRGTAAPRPRGRLPHRGGRRELDGPAGKQGRRAQGRARDALADPEGASPHRPSLMSPARRAREIEPFLAVEVAERAQALERAGVDVVNLHYGEPDFEAPVAVTVDAAEGWQLSAEAVRPRLGARTRGILINSPANPTGAVLSAHTLRALAELGVPIVADEIYHGLNYAGRDHSILEFMDH